MKRVSANPRFTYWLIALAIVGQVTLVASSFLLSRVSQYDILHDSISSLAIGHFGFIETATFYISGIGTLALAWLIRRSTLHLPGSFTSSFLVGIYGVGGILVAIFPTDHVNAATGLATHTAAGTIHIAAAVVSFVCVTIGMFVLSWIFTKDAKWRSFSQVTLICACAAFALLIVQLNFPLPGLTERLVVCVVAIWIILTANKIRIIGSCEEPRA